MAASPVPSVRARGALAGPGRAGAARAVSGAWTRGSADSGPPRRWSPEEAPASAAGRRGLGGPRRSSWWCACAPSSFATARRLSWTACSAADAAASGWSRAVSPTRWRTAWPGLRGCGLLLRSSACAAPVFFASARTSTAGVSAEPSWGRLRCGLLGRARLRGEGGLLGRRWPRGWFGGGSGGVGGGGDRPRDRRACRSSARTLRAAPDCVRRHRPEWTGTADAKPSVAATPSAGASLVVRAVTVRGRRPVGASHCHQLSLAASRSGDDLDSACRARLRAGENVVGSSTAARRDGRPPRVWHRGTAVLALSSG